MKALDSSVVVAALLSWHEAHKLARRAATGNAIPAHALLETYSVLTRLPAPHRLAPGTAGTLLSGWFQPKRILVPGKQLTSSLVDLLVRSGISGGASYDALVGLTAAGHGLELLTRDQRAIGTYEALGVPHRLLEDAGTSSRP